MTDQTKIIKLELTELDVTILLEALGAKQINHYDRGLSTKGIDILVDRIYRALGVRLDKQK